MIRFVVQRINQSHAYTAIITIIHYYIMCSNEEPEKKSEPFKQYNYFIVGIETVQMLSVYDSKYL